jgi:hypothetical protein
MQVSGVVRIIPVVTIWGAFLALLASPLPLAATTQATQADSVARAERDFGRLDAEAGLRSGGVFPFDFQYLVYYDAASQQDDGLVSLWTAASVQADKVRAVFDGGWTYSLDMTVELTQDDTLAYRGETRSSVSLVSRLSGLDLESQGFPVQNLMRVVPGEYDYVIRIKDNGWYDDRAVNEKRGRIVVPKSILSQPFISSIALAADSGGTWNPAPDLELKLNAARMVESDSRPYVYFEAYGLTPGGSYRGEIRLVSRWVSTGQGERFTGVFQPYQLQYRGSVPADPSAPVRKLLRLDMSRSAPGPYEIQIRVRDLETGLASEVRSARIKVREPDRFSPIVPIVEVERP